MKINYGNEKNAIRVRINFMKKWTETNVKIAITEAAYIFLKINDADKQPKKQK